MRSKIILGKFGQLSYRMVILFLVFAFMALTGCGKSCTGYEKELNAYADGSKPLNVSSAIEARKVCMDALAKCPNLAVAFEVMGDINVRDQEIEDAGKNYDKALALNKDNERVLAKKERISEAISEAKSKAAADKFGSIKDMNLVDYARLEESMRITWCEKAINDPIQYVFTDRSRGATFVPQFSGTPEDLDRLLISLVEKEPSRQTSNAAAMFFVLSGK
jgi:hypothetical protein